MAPKLGERWNDPACGTFGFMIAIDHYLKERYDYVYDTTDKQRKFQETEALSGVELVQDAHRLALMNAKLHGLDSTIYLNDTLILQANNMFRSWEVDVKPLIKLGNNQK